MFTNIITITKIFTKYARNNLGFYFLGVVFFPLSLLIPLIILVDAANRADIFIGSAICATTIMTITDISDIISHDKYANSISFFITRPVKPYQYILGVGLSTLFYNLVGVVVIFSSGILFLDFSVNILQLLGVFVVIFIGWFISCSLGFIIGMWGPRDPRMNTSLASMIAYVLTFLAPTYYPISALPPFLQKLSYLFYTTSLSMIGKNLIRHDWIHMVNVYIILIYLAISLVILFKVTRWKTT
ncbi:MAG: ABC transporter permease [Candidatus Atribacteria bacterium]|nr:ABC transporter permease [Candidatus Atribacteria bacterium]